MQSTDGDKKSNPSDETPDGGPDGSPDGAGTPPSSSTRPQSGAESEPPAGDNAAERLIAAFGGIRPMAAKVGVPATTVQGWKKRGVIPESRREELLKAAADNDITLDDTVLANALATEKPDEGGEAASPVEAAAKGSAKGAGRATAEREPRRSAGVSAAQPGAERTAATDGGAAGAGVAPVSAAGAPAQRRDGGLLTLAVVALVIAVIGVAGLITYPAWSPRYLDTPDPTILADRIDTLESSLDEAMAGPRAAVEDFESRITDMEESLDAALRRIDAFTGVEIDGRPLADILDDLDLRLGGVAERVDQVDDRLAARLPALADRIAAIEDQEQAIDTLAGRVSGLEAERAALGDVRQSVDSLDRRLNAVQDDLSGLTQRLQTVSGLAEQVAATDASTMALVLAVGQLRDALFIGAPFRQSLETVAAVSSGDPEMEGAIDALEPFAADGAPTLSELQNRFPAMASAVREAARTPETGSWADEALSRMQGLVTVRPTAGEIEGDSHDAILARAEIRVMSDNLRGAVTALEDLEGAMANAASSWISLARDRIAVEDALSDLNDIATRRLMATREGG